MSEIRLKAGKKQNENSDSISREELLRNEDIISGIIENTSDPVYFKDIKGRLILCNQAFEKLFCKSAPELLGKSEWELLASGMEASDSLVMETRVGLRTEESISTPDGRRTFISNRVPVRDEDGIIIGVLTILHDITERIIAEGKLRQNEKELNELIRFAPIAIYEIDFISRKFTNVNESMVRLSGYSRNELLSMDVLEILEEDSRNRFLSRIAKMTRGEDQPGSIIYKVRKKDGSVIDVLLNIKFRLNETGIPVGATAIGQDITETIKVEEEREKLLSVLEETRAKLDMALESGNIGIWSYDHKKDEVIVDHRIEKMLGLEGHYEKSPKTFIDLINEDDFEHALLIVRESVKNNSLFETIFRTKNAEKYLSLKGRLTQDEHGRISGITGVCFDVTELKKGTEKLISKMNEELLRSNRELQSFAYIASHDLQEPLRMVTNFTQLLDRQYGDKLDETAKEYIRYAVDGGKRMYNLLNDLLAYSRLNTRGKEFRRVSLDDVLNNVLKNLSLVIKERKAIITAKHLPYVNADFSQMIILFQNLISNSIKFSNENPVIHISYKSEENFYVISVSDKGTGIEQQYFEKIFRIFQRLNIEKEGTGVGLALCKRIVERHGGIIWVKSAPGKGAKFCFKLPKNKGKKISGN